MLHNNFIFYLMFLFVSIGDVSVSKHFGFDVGNDSYGAVLNKLRAAKVKYKTHLQYVFKTERVLVIKVNKYEKLTNLGRLVRLRFAFPVSVAKVKKDVLEKLYHFSVELEGHLINNACKELLIHKYGAGSRRSLPELVWHQWETERTEIKLRLGNANRCNIYYSNKVQAFQIELRAKEKKKKDADIKSKQL